MLSASILKSIFEFRTWITSVSPTLKNSTYHTNAVNESTKKHDVEKVRRKGGVKETHLMALPFISSMYYMVH